MKHKDKIKLARRMQTKDERKEKGTGVFDSKEWKIRKAKRHKKEILRANPLAKI